MRYEDLNERELILLISQKVTEVADRKAIDEIVRRFDSFTMNHAKIAISYLQKFSGNIVSDYDLYNTAMINVIDYCRKYADLTYSAKYHKNEIEKLIKESIKNYVIKSKNSFTEDLDALDECEIPCVDDVSELVVRKICVEEIMKIISVYNSIRKKSLLNFNVSCGTIDISELMFILKSYFDE
jgi:hypothetical protein